MHYDYLIAGAGLFGAVFAHEMHKQGRKVLVVEKRDHIAGNIYRKRLWASTYIGMVPIFFILPMKKFGIM